MFYIEASTTFHLDIFIKIETDKGKLISLSPIYNRLKQMGFFFEKEHVIIVSIPVQFIPVYNDLTEEALLNSKKMTYGNTLANVIAQEYLVAIMIDTYRSKDKVRTIKFIESHQLNEKTLLSILVKHNLIAKYNNLRG